MSWFPDEILGSEILLYFDLPGHAFFDIGRDRTRFRLTSLFALGSSEQA